MTKNGGMDVEASIQRHGEVSPKNVTYSWSDEDSSTSHAGATTTAAVTYVLEGHGDHEAEHNTYGTDIWVSVCRQASLKL
jgi:hypothetical protein